MSRDAALVAVGTGVDITPAGLAFSVSWIKAVLLLTIYHYNYEPCPKSSLFADNFLDGGRAFCVSGDAPNMSLVSFVRFRGGLVQHNV